MSTFWSFLISVGTLIFADFVWLGVIIRPFYQRELGSLMREGSLIWWSAALVYLLMAIGITYFVLPRITTTSSMLAIFLTGALFGLVLYGVYDFTNFSFIKGYSWRFLVVDIVWGTFACGLATVVTYSLRRYFGG